MGNRRVLYFLASCILFCLALLWAIQQRRVRSFSKSDKSRARLIEQALDGVERITVEHGDARIGLLRRGAEWELVAPFPARVDQGAVARMLDGFETARVTDALSFQEVRRRELTLRDFGLAVPRTRVELAGREGVNRVLFGAFTPHGTDVYLLMNGLEQVLAVPSPLYRVLPRTADEVRSRSLVCGNRARIRSLEMRMSGHPFIRLSKEQGTWRLTQPAAAPASDARVEALLDVLYREPVERFVWPTVSNVLDVAGSEADFKLRLELYGLGAESGLQVQVEEVGGTAAERVVFGRTVEGAAALTYVLLPGGNAVGAVSNAVAQAFRLLPADLRDPRVFAGVRGVVRRLDIYVGDNLFVLSRTNALWRIEAPVSDAADQEVADEAVSRLLRLEAEGVEEAASPEAQAGTAAPSRYAPVSHVVLFGDQGETRFTVTRAEPDAPFVRLAFTNSAALYRVAASNLPSVFMSQDGLMSLRDKTVLALPETTVRRVTLKRADGSVETAQRDSAADVWRLADGQTGVLSAERLGRLLKSLTSLRAERIEKIGLTPEEGHVYGLTRPWLEMSVDVDAKDSVRKTLLVGDEADLGSRYAVVRGLDVLFVLGGDAVAELAAHWIEPL